MRKWFRATVLVIILVKLSPLTSASTLPCTFKIKEKYEFNLCPLFEPTVFEISIHEDTPPTRTTNTYQISLKEPLKKDWTLPAELQCPEGTRICLKTINTRPKHPSEPERILQVVPVALAGNSVSAYMGKKKEGEQHAPLVLLMIGAPYGGKMQRASFSFHCDPNAKEPTKPGFAYTFNGVHAFQWNTTHACHQAPPPQDPSPPSDDGPPPEDPPPGDVEDPPAPIVRPPMTSSSYPPYFLFMFALPLLLVAHFLARRSRRRIPFMSAFKFNSFRPSPQRLVLWAQQEEFPDYDLEEEIPLSPHPAYGVGKPPASPGVYGSFG